MMTWTQAQGKGYEEAPDLVGKMMMTTTVMIKMMMTIMMTTTTAMMVITITVMKMTMTLIGE